MTPKPAAEMTLAEAGVELGVLKKRIALRSRGRKPAPAPAPARTFTITPTIEPDGDGRALFLQIPEGCPAVRVRVGADICRVVANATVRTMRVVRDADGKLLKAVETYEAPTP